MYGSGYRPPAQAKLTGSMHACTLASAVEPRRVCTHYPAPNATLPNAASTLSDVTPMALIHASGAGLKHHTNVTASYTHLRSGSPSLTTDSRGTAPQAAQEGHERLQRPPSPPSLLMHPIFHSFPGSWLVPAGGEKLWERQAQKRIQEQLCAWGRVLVAQLAPNRCTYKISHGLRRVSPFGRLPYEPATD